MSRFFDRVFRFLNVDDPKQTKINRLFFALIVGWIGLGFCINVIGQLYYYLVTLPRAENVIYHNAGFMDLFQIEVSKMTDLEKILLGAISTLATVIVAMAMFIKSTLKYIADDKDGREENDRKDRAETLAVISNNSRVIEGFKEFLQRFKQ